MPDEEDPVNRKIAADTDDVQERSGAAVRRGMHIPPLFDIPHGSQVFYLLFGKFGFFSRGLIDPLIPVE